MLLIPLSLFSPTTFLPPCTLQLPPEAPYEIVRVQDEEDLKKQNEFYKDVKEGDYILMYKKVAIIYDLRNNAIVAIKRD